MRGDTGGLLFRNQGRLSEIQRGQAVAPDAAGYESGTSIFDPVLCELSYLWFCPRGGVVLDPFSGGSVRGIVAAKLGLRYVGVDLSARQIEANREQAARICANDAHMPEWRVGDSTEIADLASDVDADLVFSCPPYADLEQYSDDPRDISNMPYPRFLEAYRRIIAGAVTRLKQDRFACFVVGEVRGPDGHFLGLPRDTIGAFEDAGAKPYNRAVLVTAVGSAPIRAGRAFAGNRKLTNTYQDVLYFVKGSWREASVVCGNLDEDDNLTPLVANIETELHGGGLLGQPLAPKRQGRLAERFMIPPLNLFSAREGFWQNRKRAWISLGIQSELGRGGELTYHTGDDLDNYQHAKRAYIAPEALAAITVVAGVLPPPVRAAVRPVRAVPVVAAPNLPASDWQAPTELPSLRGKGIKRIGFDTETKDPLLTTLGPGVRRGGKLVGFSIAVEDGPSWYFPVAHEGGGNLDEGNVRQWAKDELNWFDGEVVGAHLIYDLDFGALWGIDFSHVTAFHDIQIVEALLDEWCDDFSLDALSTRYLGEGKDELLLQAYAKARGWVNPKEHIHEMPAKYVGPYASADADRPLRVWAKQQVLLESEGLEPIYEIERKLIPILLAMRRRGVRVNLGRAEEVKNRLVTQRDQYLAEARRLAGSNLVELMAPESFAKALSERGLRYPMTAKSGKPSITKAWLRENESDDLVAAIQKGRRLEPIINTFLSGHIQTHAIPEGNGYGRVHCQFNQMRGEDEDGNKRGAIARFSSSYPNLQNLPKRDEELGPLIRSIFEPDDNSQWGSLDLSQIEWRYLTHFAIGSGSDDARRQYNEDRTTDYYRMVMEFAGADTENKRIRDAYKAVVLAKGYGAGRGKLMRMICAQGLSEDEASRVVDNLDQSLPFAKATYDSASATANERGYVLTILKRRQRFPYWAPRGKEEDFILCRDREEAVKRWGSNICRAWNYKALNRALQGSAADHMKKAMVDYWEAGIQNELGAPLVTVHDELGLSIGEGPHCREALAEAKRIMEECIQLRVPVLCKQEVGPNWGELE